MTTEEQINDIYEDILDVQMELIPINEELEELMAPIYEIEHQINDLGNELQEDTTDMALLSAKNAGDVDIVLYYEYLDYIERYPETTYDDFENNIFSYTPPSSEQYAINEQTISDLNSNIISLTSQIQSLTAEKQALLDEEI